MNRSRAALLALPFFVLTSVLSAAPTLLLPLPQARVPIAGVLSGGQPSQVQIAAAGTAGFKSVINLRPDTEPGFAWEPEAVRVAGMAYVSIPVAGAAGLTRENVTRFDAALEEASARGPVILHCSSGNRVGALLALRAAWLDGKDPATALEYGRASGLTGLEPAVTSLLGLPQAAPAQTPK